MDGTFESTGQPPPMERPFSPPEADAQNISVKGRLMQADQGDCLRQSASAMSQPRKRLPIRCAAVSTE